jgi:hypothetical protein
VMTVQYRSVQWKELWASVCCQRVPEETARCIQSHCGVLQSETKHTMCSTWMTTYAALLSLYIMLCPAVNG